MAYGIHLEVWGDRAAFNRPEMKVERVSYDVMTPSAARGFIEAIYWKPQIRWVIDRIHVLAPIRHSSIRRNEIASKIPVSGGTGVQAAMKRGAGNLGLDVQEARQQRAALILAAVRYGIVAHAEVIDDRNRDGTRNGKAAAKHIDMFRRRAEKGQYFHHPYLGCREFPGFFRWVDGAGSWACPEELRGERDLGFMLWDIEFAEDTNGKIIESNQGRRLIATPRFFHARMLDGVVEVPRRSETRG